MSSWDWGLRTGDCSYNLSFFSFFGYLQGLVTFGLLGELLGLGTEDWGLGIALTILVFLVFLVIYRVWALVDS